MSPGNKTATTVTAEETIGRTSRIVDRAVDATAVDEQLSGRRLNIMRFGYAFMGVGLVIVKWPLLLDASSLPVMDGVVLCLLTAMSLLAFLGLRYPFGCCRSCCSRSPGS